MTTKQLKNRGFTLVELLIVIVIIAILTVIALVAYNGIQNQARKTTAESSAKTAADKVQIYYTKEGKYPTDLGVLGSASVNEPYHIDSNAVIYEVGGTLQGAFSDKPDKPNTVGYKRCNDNGGQIYWYDFTQTGAAGNQVRKLGDQTGC